MVPFDPTKKGFVFNSQEPGAIPTFALLHDGLRTFDLPWLSAISRVDRALGLLKTLVIFEFFFGLTQLFSCFFVGFLSKSYSWAY